MEFCSVLLPRESQGRWDDRIAVAELCSSWREKRSQATFFLLVDGAEDEKLSTAKALLNP